MLRHFWKPATGQIILMQLSISERARRYIVGIHSLSGSGGHLSALNAACALVKGFDLSEETALELLTEWNATNALPPWPMADLRHKIREAAKSDKPSGYLLANDRHQPPSTQRPRASAPPPVVNDAAAKARQREQWPAFRVGTLEELRTLASLRKIGPGIAWTAQREGLLRFTTSRAGELCYVLTEGTLGQVRRLDGQPFTKPDGSTMKSKNLLGSEGKWLGYDYAERHPNAPVIIVEGLVAWLEAAHVITSSDSLAWVPFAALSASVKLEARELVLLAGRRVLIARDRGSEGAAAAVNWQDALQATGTHARIWNPPTDAKDLGEAMALPTFNPNSIFNLA